MSGAEDPGGEVRRQPETWGSASDNGHVYQSKGSQFISHVHLHGGAGAPEGATAQAGTHGRDLEHTQERVDLLIRALSLTQGEWQARCAELEEKARRAMAEGRAQALAEAQEQLRAAELRVMKAQQMMREAERERQRTQALLTRAQQELALRRRAEERRDEREARRRQAPRAEDEPARTAQLNEEGEQFTDILERAEAELGAVRNDLRRLSEETATQNRGNLADRVIEGQGLRHPAEGAPPAPREAVPVRPADDGAISTPGRSGSVPVPASPAWVFFELFVVGVMCVLAMIPACIPMFVVTSVRAAYASGASLWKVVPFTIVTVLVGLAAWGLTHGLAMWALEAGNPSDAVLSGVLAFALVEFAVTLASCWTPLTLPGPLGAWGRGLVSAVGVG
ncbi:hypothetical protein ACWC09_39130 [Streptomyces sp. NPDC001617]